MRRSLVLLAASASLMTGCVGLRSSTPIAVNIPAPSLDAVRTDTVRTMVALYPPAASRLYIVAPDDGFGTALTADLRRAGYALVEGADGADAAPGYNLRYGLARLDDNMIAVTLHVGTTTLGRVYAVEGANTTPASAWSVDLSHASADFRERVELLASSPRDSASESPATSVAVTDAGSPAWAARLRAGPAPRAAETAAPVEQLAVPAASPAADKPPLPPRVTGRRSMTPVPVIVVPLAVAKPAPGPWRVQLGAYDTDGYAKARARDLLHRHAAVLASASPFFVRVGSQLPRTVVQVGPYATRADAISVCLGLRATRADCIVARG